MVLQYKPYEPLLNEAIEHLIQDDEFVKEDMLKCLEAFPELGIVAYKEEILAGVAVFSGARSMTSFTLYIKPELRKQGYGTELYQVLTEKMRESGVKEVVCDYLDKEPERNFLSQKGYETWFQSNHMTYEGQGYPEPEYKIVPYQDEFYHTCQKIQSDSFHRMRLSVGMPSVQAQPSEEDRQNYLEEADSIYVLMDQENTVGILRLEGAEVDAVAVAYEFQGQGYGKALTQFGVNRILEAGHSKVTLWAVEGNPAKFMYEKLGFTHPRLHTFVKKKL